MGFSRLRFYPAHPDNAILLCANCHTEFDDSIPGFIVLPTNLDFFIEYEEIWVDSSS